MDPEKRQSRVRDGVDESAHQITLWLGDTEVGATKGNDPMREASATADGQPV